MLDNDPYLDTTYNGVDITATKRMSHNWQMVAGFSAGKNTGGLNTAGTGSGQSGTTDLNDPNNIAYTSGIVGNDSTYAFRLSGSYRAPYEIVLAGTLVSNSGFPYVSTYSVTRALAAAAGVNLTRSTQSVFLSDRGDERFPTVTSLDLRISRAWHFAGGRRIEPEIDFFNLMNASPVTTLNTAVSPTYLYPSVILSPRIIRVGFAVNF